MIGPEFAPAQLVALVFGIDRRYLRPSLREHLVLARKLLVEPRQLIIERRGQRLGAVCKLVLLQFLLTLGQAGNVGFCRLELAFDGLQRPAAREVDLFFTGVGMRQRNVPPRLVFLPLGDQALALVFGFLGFGLRRRQRRIDFLDLPAIGRCNERCPDRRSICTPRRPPPETRPRRAMPRNTRRRSI